MVPAVLEDLQVLEQQQQESKRKLAQAQATKQNRINQQKQLNAQLEGKKYSNGALYAQVEQSRKFLSGATRDLSSCKLVSERLTEGISAFERKLKQSLYFTRLVISSNQKIESVIISVEHKIGNVARLKMEAKECIQTLQTKVSCTEDRYRIIRSAIQEAHAVGHNCAEEQAGLRVANSKLEKDRIAAQNLNQSTKLKCDGVREQIKKMEERANHSKAVQLQDLEILAQHEDGYMLEQESLDLSIVDADKLLQLQRQSILEFQKHLDFELGYASDDGTPNVVDSFGPPLAAMAAKGNDADLDQKLLKEKLHEVEKELNRSHEEILQNDALASTLLDEAELQAKEQADRELSAVASQREVETAVEEASILEGSFVDLQILRDTEVAAFVQSMGECENAIAQHEQTIATLEKQIRMADNAIRTQTRLFDETEKPKLVLLEREAENRSKTAGDHHKSMVDRSSTERIETNLKTEYGKKRKIEQEIFDERCRELDEKRDKYIESTYISVNCFYVWMEVQGFVALTKIIVVAPPFAEYPRLATFIVSFDHKRPIKELWEDVLDDLKKECDSKQANAQLKQVTRARAQRDEIQQLVVAAAKIKTREDQRRKRSKKFLDSSDPHQGSELQKIDNPIPLHEDDIAEGFVFASKDPVVYGGRRMRKKKGSGFFNPRNDDNAGIYDEETPTQPKQLFQQSGRDPQILTMSTSILSSICDKRVHWKVGDSILVGDKKATVNTSGLVPSNQGASKSRDASSAKNRKLESSSDLNHSRTTHSNTPPPIRFTMGRTDDASEASKAKHKTKNGPNDDLHTTAKSTSSRERRRTDIRIDREIPFPGSSDSFRQKQVANTVRSKNKQDTGNTMVDSGTDRRQRKRLPTTSVLLDTLTLEPTPSKLMKSSRSRSGSNPEKQTKHQESLLKTLIDSVDSESKTTKPMYDSRAEVVVTVAQGTLSATSKEKSRRNKSPMNSTVNVEPSVRMKSISEDGKTKSPKEKRRESKKKRSLERLQVPKESVKMPQNSISNLSTSLSLRQPLCLPKKRKERDHTPASEKSSSNLVKARRRRKKDIIGSQRSFATAMTADTFNFCF
jgi:hypothetical protein